MVILLQIGLASQYAEIIQETKIYIVDYPGFDHQVIEVQKDDLKVKLFTLFTKEAERQKCSTIEIIELQFDVLHLLLYFLASITVTCPCGKPLIAQTKMDREYLQKAYDFDLRMRELQVNIVLLFYIN